MCMNIKDFMSKEQLENYNNNSEEEYQNVTENVLKIKVTDIAAEFYRNKGRDDNTYNTLEDLYIFKDINTIRDLVSLSPEELAFKVGRYGEKGYNDVVNVLKMYGIDVNRYINYQYNVDVLSLGLQEFALDLSIRTYNALLHSRKVETIKDLARLSPKEIMQIKGIGKKGYNEVVNLLKECGIKNNVTHDNTGGMTRYKPNIDLEKCNSCKITDPKQEMIEEGAERIRKVLTVKELIDVLSAIENKDLEVYVRGNTWKIVPCNQVIECSGDGDCLLLASDMEFDTEKVVNDLTDD